MLLLKLNFAVWKCPYVTW